MLDALLRQLLLLIEPLGFTWFLLLVLTAVLAWKRRFGVAACTLGIAAFIFVIGATDLPAALLKGLERPYAGMDVTQLPRADAVVMLGGGIEPSRYEAGGFHLTRAGDRLLMAVQTMRLGKAPVLLLGGGGAELDSQVRVEADLVRGWIRDWRLLGDSDANTPEVISLGRCADTHDEATRVHSIATARGWHSVLLVTSAAHMHRAVATFEAAGVRVTPVPCNFLTTVSTSAAKPGLSVPRYEGFEKVSVWLHEVVGWIEYRRRGWVRPGKTDAAAPSSAHQAG